MANQKQLDILKQGVQEWNEWRAENPDVQIDLSGAFLGYADLRAATLSAADLRGAYLGGATLSAATLSATNLSAADLSAATLRAADLSAATLRAATLRAANLSGAHLGGATLSAADLRSAYLGGATLGAAKLSDADLSKADLSNTDLSNTDLGGANLGGANLGGAKLSRANLRAADLSRVSLVSTAFGNVDFSTVKGLETVRHGGPSTIGIDTIYRSGGNIPEAFLRGAGVDDTFITYIRSLVGKAIDYSSCFISYSSKDEAFAKRLYADLQSNNVRCWFAPEDMKIGDKIRPRIDESIRLYDKLLLVLSEHSAASKWVEFEVEAAMDKEQEGKPLALFPVRLDNTVLESTTAWAAHIKRTRHIGDFTHWKNHDDYEKAFSRLLRDLKAESV